MPAVKSLFYQQIVGLMKNVEEENSFCRGTCFLK
jgi:hypothetical protein